VKELYQALMRAKQNINPPQKTGKAMYGRYATLEAVLRAVEGPLANEGLLISQVGVCEQETPILRTIIIHADTGQTIHSDIPLVSRDDKDPQKLGGSMTYARRYGISAILSIVADDDDDGNTSAGKQRDGTAQPKVTKEMLEALKKEIAKVDPNTNPIQFATTVLKTKVTQLEQLTVEQARQCVIAARSMSKKAESEGDTN
jgi:hypothetical protein